MRNVCICADDDDSSLPESYDWWAETIRALPDERILLLGRLPDKDVLREFFDYGDDLDREGYGPQVVAEMVVRKLEPFIEHLAAADAAHRAAATAAASPNTYTRTFVLPEHMWQMLPESERLAVLTIGEDVAHEAGVSSNDTPALD